MSAGLIKERYLNNNVTEVFARVKQETAVLKRYRAGRRNDKNKTQKTTKYKERNIRHWLSWVRTKRRQSSWSLWELLERSFNDNPLYSAISSWISSYTAPSPPWQWSCVRESRACAVLRETREGGGSGVSGARLQTTCLNRVTLHTVDLVSGTLCCVVGGLR